MQVLASESCLRSRYGGLQATGIAQSGGASVEINLLLMNLDQLVESEK